MDPNQQGKGFNRSRSKRSVTSKHPAIVVPLPESGSNLRLGKTTSNKSVITFSQYKNVKLDMPQDNALIITIELAGVAFSKVLVDSGCVAYLLSHETLEKIDRPTW
ncbi:RNA-directed DNA polymerase [Raphanus sativus]|nr:RNA-directed DNA polymerase [Raphanus sativus]